MEKNIDNFHSVTTVANPHHHFPKVRRSKRAVVLAKDRLKKMPLDRFTSSGDYVGETSGDQNANRDFTYDDDDVYYNSGDDAYEISGKDADRNRKESNWNINEA